MTSPHRNDDDTIRALLADPGTWAVVGLSNDTARAASGVARWLKYEQGKAIIPIHPDAETVDGDTAYASLADIPDGTDLKVVDCFVASDAVGAVVDEAITHRERLRIDAVWLQLGVVDEGAATRAHEAGLAVVMDTCPKVEWRRLRGEGASR